MPPLRDDKLPLGAGADEAHLYIQAHGDFAKRCNTISDASLKRMYNAALAKRGMTHLSGMDGWSHDELVNGIVDLEFPDMTLAQDIWYRHVQMPAIGQE